MDVKTASDLGVSVEPRLQIIKTEEPATRTAGIMVSSVDELVEKLEETGVV